MACIAISPTTSVHVVVVSVILAASIAIPADPASISIPPAPFDAFKKIAAASASALWIVTAPA
jgi:hypothetical protein